MKRMLLAVATSAFLVWVLAVWLPGLARSEPPTLTVMSTTSSSLVDGHDVDWWAARARRNGAHYRAVRASLRAHVGLGARRLAHASTQPDGLVRAFLCIHRFEAPWPSTTNPTYDGGLQMDDGFQSHYGAAFRRAWGPAYNWPPFVQIAVAMNAYLSGRGFWPWPNTARICGLLP